MARRPPRPFHEEVALIIVRMLLGLGLALLLWLVYMKVITHTVTNMQNEILANSQKAQVKASAQYQQIREREAAQRLEQQHRQTMSEEEARRQQVIENQKNAKAAQARAQLERQKSAAWSQFYKEPSYCSNWQTDQQMVECQNHKLRTRSEFEQKWAAGELDQSNG